MQRAFGLALALLLGACGDSPEVFPSKYVPGFHPPAPASTELELAIPLLKDLAPGTDVTLCSYLDAHIQDETDVVNFRVFQSRHGHHVIIYTARHERPVGTHVCTEDDMVNTHFVAAGGSEGVGTIQIPDGLAFRIPPNSQIMVQSHWINAAPESADGQVVAYLTPKPSSPQRVPLDLFNIVLTDFNVPAGQQATSSTTCTLGHDVQLYSLNGHAHELATQVSIELLDPAGGASNMLWTSPWQPAYQSNPPVNLYSDKQPLVLKAGQKVRVTCSWDNTMGTSDLAFPREMCAGSGFYFPALKGEIDCTDGVWDG